VDLCDSCLTFKMGGLTACSLSLCYEELSILAYDFLDKGGFVIYTVS